MPVSIGRPLCGIVAGLLNVREFARRIVEMLGPLLERAEQ